MLDVWFQLHFFNKRKRKQKKKSTCSKNKIQEICWVFPLCHQNSQNHFTNKPSCLQVLEEGSLTIGKEWSSKEVPFATAVEFGREDLHHKLWLNSSDTVKKMWNVGQVYKILTTSVCLFSAETYQSLEANSLESPSALSTLQSLTYQLGYACSLLVMQSLWQCYQMFDNYHICHS